MHAAVVDLLDLKIGGVSKGDGIGFVKVLYP